MVVVLAFSVAAIIVFFVACEGGPEWRIVERPAHDYPFVVERRTYYPTGGVGWMAVAKCVSREQAETYIREKITEAERRVIAEFNSKGEQVKK